MFEMRPKIAPRHPEFTSYMATLGHVAGDITRDNRLDTITRMQILKYITAIELLLNRPNV